MATTERRQHERFPLNRPGKVYDGRSRKYMPCLAVDVSQGGALIELKHPIPVSPGVHLFLAVGGRDEQALLRSDEMLEVEVIRTMRFDQDRQFLAVRFVHTNDVAINAERIAA